jgi:hypothetical protein
MKLTRLVPTGLLFVLLIVLTAGNVHAQTTSISNLTAPTSVMVENGASVTFTVTYSTGYSGDWLGIGVWDVDANTFAAGSLSQSSPDTCQRFFTSYEAVFSAICGISFTSTGISGSETVTFNLKFNMTKEYNLRAFAVIEDSAYNVLQGSLTNQAFSIRTRDRLSLSVQAEYPVVVTIDGVAESPGSALVNTTFGRHTISVPPLVNVTSGVRLRFDHWSDGSTSATKNAYLTDNTSYTPVYVKQYELTLATSQGNATGEGWIDEGSEAKFTVQPTVPMTGILGILGGKFDFQGWYEGNTLVSADNSGSLTMNSQHMLTANWTPNYTIPIIVIGVVVIGAIVSYLVLRSSSKPGGSSTPKVDNDKTSKSVN